MRTPPLRRYPRAIFPTGPSTASRPVKVLYSATVALSAALLFTLEPMITRALMPALGGSSAVWMTALAFFQLTLLLGYGYTVALTRSTAHSPRAASLHLGLLALAALTLLRPFEPTAQATTSQPQLYLFALLALSIGLPFLTLSTSAPLLQAWFAQRERSPIPYRLFALSNLASLAALLAYPTLLERFLPLNRQILLWKVAFLAYLLLAATLTLRSRTATPLAPATPDATPTPPSPTLVSPATKPQHPTHLWLLLPAIASLQLAAVTGHLVQDVAAMPLLWVLPLAAYLLTFVLAFDLPRLYNRSVLLRLLAVLLFALGYFLLQPNRNLPILLSIAFFTAELFLAAWFCHAELFSLRPSDPALSPRFYLTLAAGGALGTLLVAVLSPLLTRSNLDLPFAFLATALLILLVTWREGWPYRLLWTVGAALGLFLLLSLRATLDRDALFRDRNFYGSLRVRQSQYPPQAFLARSLYNGAIEHGMQWFSTAFHREPLTYYTRDSGVGLGLQLACATAHPCRIGVIGLGAGTLAAYGRPGDQLRFYEINPMVTDVATHLFTYTRDTPATVTVIPGDARLSLAAEPPNRFDVLVIDAFSGDSIPTHLLTREALALYRRHLALNGILAFHISNQFLDLEPVLARLTLDSNTSTPATSASHPSLTTPPILARKLETGPNNDQGQALATWVLLTTNPQLLTHPSLSAAHPLQTQPDVLPWTDQYTSLLPILRWTGKH